MILSEIEQTLQQAFSDCKIEIKEEEGHYYITVIGNQFANQSLVERQKTVYAPLSHYITEGKLHAVHITVKTEEEWNDS